MAKVFNHVQEAYDELIHKVSWPSWEELQQTTVITLADFNQLAEQAEGFGAVLGNDTRTEALWRALLQYPAASIWVEAYGQVSGGQSAADLNDTILVEENRDGFTVYAALPQSDALSEWQESYRQRALAYTPCRMTRAKRTRPGTPSTRWEASRDREHLRDAGG